MPFSKTLIAFLSILAIIPGAAIKSVKANTPIEDINAVDTECVNYMVTSGGETICLDSASPVEPEPDVVEPDVGLDCAPEPVAEEAPPSEPDAEVASSVDSAGELDPVAEAEDTAESASDPVMEEEEPVAESATAEEASPELLADAACSPESSVEDVEPSP